MKRLLVIALVVWMLTACAANQTPDETTLPVVETTEDPRAGLPAASALVQEHAVNLENQGAVTVYDLSNWSVGSFQAVYPCGNAVAAHEASGVLWVFDPVTGLVNDHFDDVYEILSVSDTGFAAAESDTVVATYRFDDHAPIRWNLPGDIQGKPVVDLEGKQIYYCTPGKVFALDMETGLTRTLREHSYGEALPGGIYGDMLELLVGQKNLLISTTDGRTLYEEGAMTLLGISGNKALITGTEDGVLQTLLVEDSQVLCSLDAVAEDIIPGKALGGVIHRQAESLAYYEMPTGQLVSRVLLNAIQAPIAMEEDRIWFLEENTLYCWDLTQPGVEGAAQSISKPYYTAQAPDTEGIQACKERAATIGKTYGIKIRIWDDIVPYAATGFDPEYRVDVLETLLDRLEVLLPQFPENFLKITVQNDWVYVDLVKQIQGGAAFVQSWEDGGCHVAITLGADMEEAFYTGLGWGVDSHILGNSRDLEYWEDLNPQGFAYDYDFTLTQKRDDAQYLTDGVRYFADKRSMAFPTEDRARIFYYAMTQGNAELFENEVLQSKLKLVCEGIREAYNLKKYAEVLPWEQYLAEPMTP